MKAASSVRALEGHCRRQRHSLCLWCGLGVGSVWGHPWEPAPAPGPNCELSSTLQPWPGETCLHTACLWPGYPHRSAIDSASPVWPAGLLFPLTLDPTEHLCHRCWLPSPTWTLEGGLLLTQQLYLLWPGQTNALLCFLRADHTFSSEMLTSSSLSLLGCISRIPFRVFSMLLLY